ncbi:SRPBCC family protein [Arthrobacter sp. B2a2-09]|uniref:SRPBCC family protein n=1 Tax=Arthrobacter sp. B2a2-09 TaxID=2952822 RepID=UPI0022CD2A40|nr:SRPBCC family protein [Arthrobacter sp. B2a2-09]MCZ9884409.1 SRPBCC family protein [Arthrobacter sp. B2a2-09]
MATVSQIVDVDVPVSVAYNQWTQFETFPEFMKGVEAVEQIDETALHFSTNVGGVKRDYNAQILEQVPDSLVSWASIDGPRHAGTVRFEPLGSDSTRVSVEIEWEPESLAEKAGSLVGIDDLRVSADLDKFKKFIEARGYETGGWRGSMADGDVDDAGAEPHVGQYTEGDYGTERVSDLPAERIQGDYTAEETPRSTEQ